MMLALTLTASAQSLAHRNWEGNGLANMHWWQNAVFYCLDINSFQDSDGDGKGDVPGIVQRLDYLQSLGVDAIIMGPPGSGEEFDDLIRAANARHLRIVIVMEQADEKLDSVSRQWLARGAAGIALSALAAGLDPPDARDFASLRHIVNSFPGDRVLIAAPDPTGAGTAPFQLVTVGNPFPKTLWANVIPVSAEKPDAPLPSGSRPIHTFYEPSLAALADKEESLGLQKLLAARLLLQPGSVWVASGDELGEQAAPAKLDAAVMSWTPTNLTVAPKPEAPAPVSNAPDPRTYNASNYTTFKPYIPSKPGAKHIPAGTPPDPAALPGFSTKPVPHLSPNIATANVAFEDADLSSLLNFYRRLSQLHHDHPALRGGELTDIDLSAQKAFAWVIKAPANTRTARNVVVVANFSDKPQTMNLDTDLSRLRIRTGGLRPLAASYTTTPPFQYSGGITLPAFAVYAGEL